MNTIKTHKMGLAVSRIRRQSQLRAWEKTQGNRVLFNSYGLTMSGVGGDAIKSTQLIYRSRIFVIKFYVNTELQQKKKIWLRIPYFEMFPEQVLALTAHLYLFFYFNWMAILTGRFCAFLIIGLITSSFNYQSPSPNYKF